jgi:predicted nucleotidyltransferase
MANGGRGARWRPGPRFFLVRMPGVEGLAKNMNAEGAPSPRRDTQPSRDAIIARLASILPELEERFGVRSLALFGSYATGGATETSDVDLLVDVDATIGLEFVTLANAIESQLGIPVDLVPVRAIKPRSRDAIEGDLVYV